MTHLSVPYVEYKGKNYFLNDQSFRAKKKRRNLLRLFFTLYWTDALAVRPYFVLQMRFI